MTPHRRFSYTTPLITTIDSVNPIASIGNPFPNGLNLVPCAKRSPECLRGTSFTFRNPNNKTPESNIDMSAPKSFQLTERFKLQFRSEFFNALNRVQWGNPDTSITGSNYGKITSQANIPWQIQFGLKLIY